MQELRTIKNQDIIIILKNQTIVKGKISKTDSNNNFFVQEIKEVKCEENCEITNVKEIFIRGSAVKCVYFD
eukprot:GAHX01003275.1.p1 GENE.GAHX01003275.1~~GAHX01003275.1.p1  ORF type:complete len:71 (+),score=11.60 GAHX01003275.1:57-269(+)